jgi:hypothetical protein
MVVEANRIEVGNANRDYPGQESRYTIHWVQGALGKGLLYVLHEVKENTSIR